ncbi:hypothetical protein S7711_11150 [Stachybotrys chartarum IBT 7711]|uniref:Uncharacterized protein n=1 Tax=Stachybotrys chartarum (strain CBS 109288 / IBT 7711) TaxID=1280523 RepID=A0A084AFN4_STACB|nr:hypothetical protein S7711_11150 [Stachybotrys chartarum IBT 7711]KFA50968.1 hypothetical protein S40293_10631 [Stachybotrys chartarum IBT 40293]
MSPGPSRYIASWKTLPLVLLLPLLLFHHTSIISKMSDELPDISALLLQLRQSLRITPGLGLTFPELDLSAIPPPPPFPPVFSSLPSAPSSISSAANAATTTTEETAPRGKKRKFEE